MSISSSPKIYCAGPLFNGPERDEMAQIAAVLEAAGFETFLPQRDGLEFAKILGLLKKSLPDDVDADKLFLKVIGYLDVYQVLTSDGLVFNYNGRVPDEGAVSEAAICAALAGKTVIYQDDARSLIEGNHNPLTEVLSDFEMVKAIGDIPAAFEGIKNLSAKDRESRQLAIQQMADLSVRLNQNVVLSTALQVGQRLTEGLHQSREPDHIVRLIETCGLIETGQSSGVSTSAPTPPASGAAFAAV